MSINITTAYKTKLKLPFGELKGVVQWCHNNLQGDWKFDTEIELDDRDIKYVNSYIFWFELEKDYVAFKIWKT